MHRAIVALLVALMVAGFAGQALANQCPKLIAQVEAATGTRYDPTAAEAKAKAAQAMELHKAGKHAESEALAKEALKLLGM
jgi:hypothetical protein